MADIKEFLQQEDPLTREIVIELIAYKEEDDRLDYKQTLNLDSEKEWLGVTKDISAFANTHGGYLLFGVDNKANILGLDRNVADFLKDASKFQQKINRHLEPDIIDVRSKEFRIDSKIVIGIFVPQSRGVTHLISKDGIAPQPSGANKKILSKGTFYVRRSAGNHLGDARDLNDVVERRIDQFREALLDKVTKVVNSPTESSVFILSKDPEAKSGDRFIIEDSPESIPVKGMSFTIAPDTLEEEIAAWSVLYRGNPKLRPPPSEVWKWYVNRNKIELKKQYKLTMFKFSLWGEAPAFFWVRELKAKDIKEILAEAIRGRPVGVDASQMLIVASFLGESYYNSALKMLGSYIERINPAQKKFPSQAPRVTYGTFTRSKKQTLAQLRAEKTRELKEITDKCLVEEKEPGRQNRMTAYKIDCFLYAQDDGYR